VTGPAWKIQTGAGHPRHAWSPQEATGHSRPARQALYSVGKVVRVAGKGLVRVDQTKSDAGRRTISLPKFAVDTLVGRRGRPFVGEQSVIFPSSSGTLRDPDNFNKQWRAVRDDLGVPDVTSHSFRKTVATLIDDEGLSARIGADHLGHANVSMTQDRYMSRGQVHSKVAELLERAINDE
jgi:integrase